MAWPHDAMAWGPRNTLAVDSIYSSDPGAHVLMLLVAPLSPASRLAQLCARYEALGHSFDVIVVKPGLLHVHNL